MMRKCEKSHSCQWDNADHPGYCAYYKEDDEYNEDTPCSKEIEDFEYWMLKLQGEVI